MTDGIMLPEGESVDWAKLAAYIDGEGYICLRTEHVGGRSHTLILRIGNTDPRLTLWLQERFGGTVNRRVASRNAKHIFYQWRINGRKAVVLLEKCLPHFVMKRDQAEIAIAFGKLMGWKIGDGWKKGRTHPKLKDEAIAQRDVLVMKLKEVRENSLERIPA
ncbi:MAG: hypothetical protein WBV46_01140 [Terriglobales bacterium]